MTYKVTVKQLGTIVAQHTIRARDALQATNLVEQQYQQADAVYPALDKTAKRILNAKHWHGYCFTAREIIN